MTRARKNRIVVSSALLGGALLDIANRNDGTVIVFDEGEEKYVHIDLAALETDPVFQAWLATNPLDAYALADHDHEIGDMVVLFNNVLS